MFVAIIDVFVVVIQEYKARKKQIYNNYFEIRKIFAYNEYGEYIANNDISKYDSIYDGNDLNEAFNTQYDKRYKELVEKSNDEELRIANEIKQIILQGNKLIQYRIEVGNRVYLCYPK